MIVQKKKERLTWKPSSWPTIAIASARRRQLDQPRPMQPQQPHPGAHQLGPAQGVGPAVVREEAGGGGRGVVDLEEIDLAVAEIRRRIPFDPNGASS